MVHTLFVFTALFILNVCYAQNSVQPIIDMHLHCMPAIWNETQTPFNLWTGLPSKAKTGEDLLPMTLVEMDKHNVVLALLSGQLKTVADWRQTAPHRLIGGPNFPSTPKGDFSDNSSKVDFSGNIEYWPDTVILRESVINGEIGVIGEITAQYAGLRPGDTSLDFYYSLAEEFDLPVCIHMGRGSIRFIDKEARSRFRIDYGNPLHVDEVLADYPNLRLYLAHAGYPFLEETIAVMQVHRNVYADLSGINWRITARPAFHNFLKDLIDAGLEDRLMFGSDGGGFPEAFELAIEGINSAEFLSQQQKQNIFYNNAARFLRLSDEQIAQHHGK